MRSYYYYWEKVGTAQMDITYFCRRAFHHPPHLSEHVARLLCDTDKGGSPAQLFELGGAHVGAGGAESTQHVPDGVFHISSVGNLDRPPLGRPGSRGKR